MVCLCLFAQENTLNDVRMRQQAMEVLACYHPFWLAVGMQTVLGCSLVRSQGTVWRALSEAPRWGAHIAAKTWGHLRYVLTEAYCTLTSRHGQQCSFVAKYAAR